MYSFQYHRPTTIDEAVAALKAAEDGRFLAGGHTLIPSMKLRLNKPSDLIDLGGIAALEGIRVEDGAVVIGAMTRHNDVASSAEVGQAIPALATLAASIGDYQVRNSGTIGGSLATNDPAADYPAAILALGATVTTDRRSIGADDFFTGLFETALDEGEIITGVGFPVPNRAGYAKFPNPASRYAIVGVMVAEREGEVRVAVTGAGPCVHRASEMEQALAGNFAPSALDGVKVAAEGLNSDIHASAEYRAHLVTVMAKRAVAACG